MSPHQTTEVKVKGRRGWHRPRTPIIRDDVVVGWWAVTPAGDVAPIRATDVTATRARTR